MNSTDCEYYSEFLTCEFCFTPTDGKIFVTAILTSFSVATICGNSLVIIAVIREPSLHSSTNYFVISLAVADGLVGLLVMPFSILYEMLDHKWIFGINWCDIWRSLDVLFSTASILNLCAISLDRYWAITDPFIYSSKMAKKQVCSIIAGIWISAGGISFPAIAWWRAVRSDNIAECTCPYTDSVAYLVVSSSVSFYFPLIIMVFTYYKIYVAAVAQTKCINLGMKQVTFDSGDVELTLRMHRGGYGSGDQGNPSTSPGVTMTSYESCGAIGRLSDSHLRSTRTSTITRSISCDQYRTGKSFSFSRRFPRFTKEKKAAKTLGIVMGVFIVCWLPFFIVNVISATCIGWTDNVELVFAIVTWLGWLNSGMNPVIYACWSKDFRRAFKKILCRG